MGAFQIAFGLVTPEVDRFANFRIPQPRYPALGFLLS